MQRLHKRPDSENWQCIYKDYAGKWRRASTRTRDKRAAELVAARFERESAAPPRPPEDETTLRAAIERVLVDRANRGRAEGTLRMHATKGGQLLRIFGEDSLLRDVNAVSVDAYVEQRLGEGAARATVHKELMTLRLALKIARRRGEYRRALDEVLPDFSGESPAGTRHVRSLEDLERLLAELPEDRAAHVAYFVATASDLGPSLTATRADIDLEGGDVQVHGTKTESRERLLPIVSFMRPLLERVVAERGHVEGPLFRPWSNVTRDLAAACARAGIERVTPRDLRRTHSKWMRSAGIEPHLIASMLGHADARMVERIYGKLPADALAKLMRERLEDRDNTVMANGPKRDSITPKQAEPEYGSCIETAKTPRILRVKDRVSVPKSSSKITLKVARKPRPRRAA